MKEEIQEINKERTEKLSIQGADSKIKSVVSVLQGDAFKKQIALALPRHMNADRMTRIALTEIRTTYGLKDCNVESLLGAIVQCSQLGLEPGNSLGHAYLIPYGKECTLIIGYKGLIDLARRSGQIISINAREVRENDVFEIEYGIDEKLRHVPNRGDRGDLIGFYAMARLKDGGHQFEYMTCHEINKIRDSSKSAKSKVSPWNNFYEEMSKKTVVRRLFKYLPVSVEIQQAVTLDEQADAGVQNNNIIDIEEEEPIEIEVESK